MSSITARPTEAPDGALAGIVGDLTERLPVRARSLIVTVFGDAIAPRDNAVWLGALIRLMQPLGVGERVVRTAVYRLNRDGWFSIRREGRRSLYAMTNAARRQFAAAETRIYAAPRDDWTGDWLLLFLPRDLAPKRRDEIRRELGWQGFAELAPNLLAHARPDREAALETLRSHGLADSAALLHARAEEETTPAALHALAGDAWNLADLAQQYRDFVTVFSDIEPVLSRIDDETRFALRTLLIHDYRRILLRDPALPAPLLPADWPGIAAAGLTARLYRRLADGADRYIEAALAADGDRAPPLKPFYTARFGGTGPSRPRPEKGTPP